jgi:serine/threonine protein phosphatase 1
MATYVISDIHGQLHIFEKLLEKIAFSEEDFLYVIGDAIDRGPDGIAILLKIMDTPNMDLLLGNHEFMMLNTVSPDGSTDVVTGRDSKLWLIANKGISTFEEYQKLDENRRKELLSWLSTRQLTKLVDAGDKTFCLTHSYYSEDSIEKTYAELSYDKVWSIVWNTPYRFDIYAPISEYTKKPWTFVIGHVPVQRIMEEAKLEIYHEENIYVIDGGCAYKASGNLPDSTCGIICMRLEDLEVTTLSFADVQ